MAIMPCNLTLFSNNTKYSLILSRPCLFCNFLELSLRGSSLLAKKNPKTIHPGPSFALSTALTVQLAAKHHTAERKARQRGACESPWNNIRRGRQTHVILGRAREFHSFSFNPGGKFVHVPGIATTLKTLHPFALNWRVSALKHLLFLAV